MTRDELWAVYVKKYPEIETSSAAFTANGFRKFFDTTYQQGFDEGFKNGIAHGKPDTKSNPFDEVFRSFGGKP